MQSNTSQSHAGSTLTYLERTDEEQDRDDEEDDIALPRAVWSKIGEYIENSRKSIPMAYSRALQDISKYHSLFKAEKWSPFLLHYSQVLLRGHLHESLYERYLKLVTEIELSIFR